MKPVALVGIGMALAMISLGDIMGGGSPLHLFNLSAFLVVLGGTAGVALASTSMEQFKAIPALYKKAFSTGPPDYRAELERIVEFAEKARREGLLALDSEVGEIEDAFVRKGMQLVVLGGTAGVTLASTSMEQFKAIPALYKKATSTGPPDYRGELDRIVGFAEKARREGLLALDGEVAEIEDPFVRKGMQLVVDGTDPEVVREILEAELDGMAARHKSGAQPFVQAGGFAPTLGILGTTMHLVVILQNLDKPETLGPMIAAAFIATLYGVGSANVVFLTIANVVMVISSQEVEV